MLAFWTLVGASLLTRLGNEDGDLSGWPFRFLFWSVHVGGGLLITVGVLALAQRWFRQTQPNLAVLLATGLIGALLFTPLALWLDDVGGRFGLVELDAEPADLPIALFYEFIELAPIFVGMWLLVQLPLLASVRTVTPDDHQSEEIACEPAESSGELMTKLPHVLGTDVLCVEADLNYIHVTTRLGKTMLLYSLRRAVEDLGEIGLLVHRSIWVAQSAVVRVKRSEQRLIVVLENGREIQVSRRRQADILAVFGDNFSR